MRRVMVVGCSGAGKSTFARRLADRTGFPVVHLDRLFWRPGWVESARPEFEAAQREHLAPDGAWICDGNYGSTIPLRLALADTVVFLDEPRRVCLTRVLRRLIRRAPRPDMTDGCEERFDLPFLRYVWRFPTDHRLRVVRMLEDARDRVTVVRLRGTREVERFLDAVSADGRTDTARPG